MVVRTEGAVRIAQLALAQVREYSAERGCTVFDEPGRRFLAPDRSRAIRISEIQPGIIYLWDTAVGNISMPRDRRSTRIKGKEDQDDKVLPIASGERELKTDDPKGPIQLCLGGD
jgi:hypothetical protein